MIRDQGRHDPKKALQIMRSKSLLAFPLLLGISAVAANAQAPVAPPQNQCFFINQFENWKAPDSKTIFIRVAMTRYYRLDLSASCPELQVPDSHLITHSRGPDTVCSAIDWDLRVSEGASHFGSPCIVKAMTLLSPDEVAAIPKGFKP
jgi:hypothetical protein